MNALESSAAVPVLFEFPDEPERAESWGRLVAVGPGEGTLVCQARVARGARLRLRFTLPGGAAVEALEGDARRASVDGDGYSRAVLLWRVSPAREALRRALLELFRSAPL